jgi:hypothetical protein
MQPLRTPYSIVDGGSRQQPGMPQVRDAFVSRPNMPEHLRGGRDGVGATALRRRYAREKGGGHSPRRELRSGTAGARCLKLHSKPLVNLCLEHLHPGTIDGALQWQVNHAGAEGKDALTPASVCR